jgi:anti-sigma factor RsiW
VTPRCDDLDAFVDGELPAERAAEFRDHLASCSRCQDALRGRMLEAAIAAGEKPKSEVAIDELAPRRSRRRWGAVTGGLAAVAAAAAAVWAVKFSGSDPAGTDGQLAFGVAVQRGGTQVRGGAAVGDTIHATASGGGSYRAVWIYRDDRELVLACPGGRTCRDEAGGVAADLIVPSVGEYAIVVMASAKPLPQPHGSLDADVAAAADAGAQYQIKQLTIR